jgi:hypothetical protein
LCEGWLIIYSTCNRAQEDRTRRDTLRRYHAIRHARVHASPAPPTGPFARHLSTLAALISGIVGSKSPPLPTSAAKVPNGTPPERRVKRCARWFDNDPIVAEVSFLP